MCYAPYRIGSRARGRPRNFLRATKYIANLLRRVVWDTYNGPRGRYRAEFSIPVQVFENFSVFGAREPRGGPKTGPKRRFRPVFACFRHQKQRTLPPVWVRSKKRRGKKIWRAGSLNWVTLGTAGVARLADFFSLRAFSVSVWLFRRVLPVWGERGRFRGAKNRLFP